MDFMFGAASDFNTQVWSRATCLPCQAPRKESKEKLDQEKQENQERPGGAGVSVPVKQNWVSRCRSNTYEGSRSQRQGAFGPRPLNMEQGRWVVSLT